MSAGFVIRARHCQPDGVGYLDKNGMITRTAADAIRFDAEGDAWIFLAASDVTGQDERGPFAWVEPG